MAEALDAIPDGSRLFLSGGSAAPMAIDRAMADEPDRWTALDLVCDRLVAPFAVFDHPGRPFRLISLQPSPSVDTMRAAGALVDHPVPFSTFASMTGPSGPWPIDVAVIHVSPPGPEGRFSLGVSVATPVSQLPAAGLVIAQVNPAMPYSFGGGELDRDEIDLLVEAEHPLVESPRAEPDEIARRIGSTVAGLIPDRATIQIGVGALADAVLEALVDHRALGVHSGMISDGIVELAASGAITGTDHPLFPGRLVAGLLGGTTRVFDFVDRNPDVVMVPTAVSHGLEVLTAIPRFHAVNSGVQVALDGSVNGETIGDRVVSGPGGAPDYAAAAARAPGGRFIVAIPATAARGRVSRIVPRLPDGAPVTVDGDLVSTVVTELGVAELAGLPPADRAVALRAVADPTLAGATGL
jgi:acyl-CoA hydrolase